MSGGQWVPCYWHLPQGCDRPWPSLQNRQLALCTVAVLRGGNSNIQCLILLVRPVVGEACEVLEACDGAGALGPYQESGDYVDAALMGLDVVMPQVYVGDGDAVQQGP